MAAAPARMSAVRRALRRHAPALFGLLLAVAFAYRAVPELRFVALDDGAYVYENPRVRAGLGGAGLRWALTAFVGGNWHPLTLASHMLDVSLHGLRPGGHHVTSLLLHLANTALLYLLLWRLSAARWRSAAVAALFGLHPLHVESVAWVAERKDVLSTLFWLLSTLAYVAYARGRTAGRYLLAALLLALGLAAKPMLVTVPLTFLLLDLWPLGRWRSPGPRGRSPWPALLAEKLPLLALAAGAAAVTLAAQRHIGAVASLETRPLAERAGNAAVSALWYLLKTAVPTGLAIPYPWPQGGWPLWQAAGAAAALTLATALALRRVRSSPHLAAGWLWYLVTLAPVVGIVQVGAQARADRYTYVPLIGVFVAAAWAAGSWAASAARRRAAAALCLAFLGACAVLSARQSRTWRTSVTLYEHAVATLGESPLLLTSLGASLMTDGRLPEAVARFERALAADPGNSLALYNLGIAASYQGDTRQALARFEAALARANNPLLAARIHNHRGELLAGSDERESVASFRKARELDPDSPAPLYNLGNWHLRSGRHAEAAEHFARVVALQPENAWAWSNLGLALARQGRADEAIARLRRAVALSPGLAIARYNLGSLLLERGDLPGAERELREALRANPGLWQASLSLGDLLARRGDAAGAAASYRAALRAQPANGEILRRLEALSRASAPNGG